VERARVNAVGSRSRSETPVVVARRKTAVEVGGVVDMKADKTKIVTDDVIARIRKALDNQTLRRSVIAFDQARGVDNSTTREWYDAMRDVLVPAITRVLERGDL